MSNKETGYIKEFFDKITIAEPDFVPQEDVAAFILAQEIAKLRIRVDELEAKGVVVAKSMKPYNVAELGTRDGEEGEK